MQDYKDNADMVFVENLIDAFTLKFVHSSLEKLYFALTTNKNKDTSTNFVRRKRKLVKMGRSN